MVRSRSMASADNDVKDSKDALPRVKLSKKDLVSAGALIDVSSKQTGPFQLFL